MNQQQITWLPGPANGGRQYFYDGDEMLVAVGKEGKYHFDVVTAHVCGEPDEEGGVAEGELECGDEPWGGEWKDVAWYVPVGKLKPDVSASRST